MHKIFKLSPGQNKKKISSVDRTKTGAFHYRQSKCKVRSFLSSMHTLV
ncbi:hypothetical protein LINPERHAP1_LOCUS3289 [Linum perenne]